MNDFIERRANPPALEGWHLKKEVNLSIIISVVGIAIACVTAYTDLKKDIELIKADQVTLRLADGRIESDTKSAVKKLEDALLRMESKLDRLIERQK